MDYPAKEHVMFRSDFNMKEWSDAIMAWAETKGWNDNLEDRSEGDWAALAHTEISEAFEAHRNGEELFHYVDDKPEGAGIEYADAMIRILHWAAHHNVDMGHLVTVKMGYNLGRSHRHGGKKV